jgi:ligand of Numb protein X 3/4
VFITDINPESVAGIDGRLKRGDQILQVNGRDVTNREETELLFAENKNAVTLLVSRCIQFTNVTNSLVVAFWISFLHFFL